METVAIIRVISWDNKHISNDSEPNPKLTKRLSPDKFFSWFTFVKFSVMYFYLLFRCKKMIAFHSCPRDILVTSKRILREKKKVNLQMHFLGQAKFMFVSSVDPILSWKTGQGRLRICNFSWDYLKYLLDYLSKIDSLYSWFTFWSENDKILRSRCG